MSRLLSRSILAALLGCVFLQIFFSMRRKSLTYDELTYIPAGYSYVTTGDYRLNKEQPPLMKLLAGAAMLPLHPKLPTENASWREAVEGGVGNTQWNFGREFLIQANPNGEQLILFARLPTVFLTMLLVLGVYLFARDLYGRSAGLLAAVLCTFEPNILAHGGLATTDLGLTCFVLWTVYGLYRVMRRPAVGNVVWAGIMLGLALLAKFSGLFLLPLLPLWALALPFLPDGMVLPESRLGRLIGHPVWDRVAYSGVVFAAITVIAMAVVSLGYLAPGRADLYFRDFQMVNVNVQTAFLTYFRGEFSTTRLPYYFLAAFLLKTPLAFLLLLGLRTAGQVTHSEEGPAARLLIFSPVVIWLVIISWKAFQIGLRYILPVYPFLIVYAAGIVAAPLVARRSVWWTVALLCIWFVGSSLRAYPNYLPYFNELAGGSEHGIDWLDDSNVDWGQDLILLREFLDETGIKELKVSPMAEYDPILYGIDAEILSPAVAMRLLSNPDPPPGIYAVSAHLLNRARLSRTAPVDPLKDLTPIAVLGHTIYVFDLR